MTLLHSLAYLGGQPNYTLSETHQILNLHLFWTALWSHQCSLQAFQPLQPLPPLVLRLWQGGLQALPPKAVAPDQQETWERGGYFHQWFELRHGAPNQSLMGPHPSQVINLSIRLSSPFLSSAVQKRWRSRPQQRKQNKFLPKPCPRVFQGPKRAQVVPKSLFD